MSTLTYSEHELARLTRTTFRDHITELNNQRPKQPFFFLKPASSILLPGAGPVIRPRGVDLHYEVELALVIGKQVKDLEADDEKGAFDAIESAFTYCNRPRMSSAGIDSFQAMP